MLQNRVTPLGGIIRTKARGTWMGNRGLLHNKQQQINRSFRLKAWITCKLEFKNWKRPVMAPGQYTELFFLDEATAFAAGHRPCAECRRDDFIKFKSLWVKANPEYGFDIKIPIGKIDEIIHEERMNATGSKKNCVVFYRKILVRDNIPCTDLPDEGVRYILIINVVADLCCGTLELASSAADRQTISKHLEELM